MIRLVPVLPEQKEMFFSINQKYLYEMTSFYPDEMDGNGNYHYGYFDEYFTDPKREAYFIFAGGVTVGFAMINPYSVIGGTPDYTMAEFTVFPSYRRRGYAKAAAELILSTRHGRWEIKYNEKNAAGKALWSAVTAPYNPTVYRLNENESVLEFEN